MAIINVYNLSLKYDNKTIIDDISFSIKEKTVNAVLSSNNSCKTTLIKTLSGIIMDFDGNIYVNKIRLNKSNLIKYRPYVSLVLDDIEEEFICNTVEEEIEYTLKNLKFKKSHIKKNMKIVYDLLKINNISNKKINDLNYFEKIKVLIASSIIHKPKVLLIDDVLRFLNEKEKKEILEIFNNICTVIGITILFTTSSLYDIKDIENVIVLHDGKIVMQDSYDNLIINDNELSKIGIEIPLMVDLSRKLQFYNLLDKVYYDRDKVVDKLWK